MIKGDILLISRRRTEDGNINVYDNIGKIIYDFREKYNSDIHIISKTDDKENMLYVSFKNNYTLYFKEGEKYYCELKYSINNIDDFREKFLFVEAVANSLFGRTYERL